MKRITYQLMTMINYGTDEEPLSEPTFSECVIECADENFEVNYLIAKSEAYEGKVEVEDIPDVPAEPTQLDRIEAQTMFTALMTDTLLEEV